MKVAVVLRGDAPTDEDLKLLDACGHIVAADGAAHALLQAGRNPDVIVGDLDSLDAEAFKWADALDIPIERHPQEKDETDGELAMQKALSMRPASVLILGGHGGRTAMFLSTLKLLRACHDAGVEAVMIGHGESVRFVSAGQQLAFAGRTGSVLNVLAVDGDATVSLQGTKWTLDHETLSHATSRGVSNKILGDGAQLEVHEGTVLAIVERPVKENGN